MSILTAFLYRGNAISPRNGLINDLYICVVGKQGSIQIKKKFFYAFKVDFTIL